MNNYNFWVNSFFNLLILSRILGSSIINLSNFCFTGSSKVGFNGLNEMVLKGLLIIAFLFTGSGKLMFLFFFTLFLQSDQPILSTFC